MLGRAVAVWGSDEGMALFLAALGFIKSVPMEEA